MKDRLPPVQIYPWRFAVNFATIPGVITLVKDRLLRPISIFIPGLLGHAAQPLVLAHELALRGYDVEVVGAKKFADQFKGTNVRFTPIEFEGDLSADQELWQAMSAEPDIIKGEMLLIERGSLNFAKKIDQLTAVLSERRDRFLIIEFSLIFAQLVAERMKIDFIVQRLYLGEAAKVGAKLPHFMSGQPVNLTPFNQLRNVISSLRWSWYNRNLRNRLAPLFSMLDLIGKPDGRPPVALVTSCYPLEIPRPLPPWFHLTGPVFSDQVPDPDPELAAWLDINRDQTAVYVATGSLSYLKLGQLKVMIEALEPFPVLWSLRAGAEGLNFPSAHKILQWVPQAAVLSHPAIKVFLSHCGLNSVFESLRFGKPILSLPFFGDQHYHAARLMDLGAGLTIDKRNLNVGEIRSKLTKLSESGPSGRARHLSAVIKQCRGRSRCADLVELYNTAGTDFLFLDRAYPGAI